MPKTVYVEHEGVLYRGFGASHPQEYWASEERAWKPHAGAGEQKPPEWGCRLSEEEAHEMMGLAKRDQPAAE
jgi:hypothetical protein